MSNLDIIPEMPTAALSVSTNVNTLPDLASNNIAANNSPLPTSSDLSSILGESASIPMVNAESKSAGYPKHIDAFNIRRGSAGALIATAMPVEETSVDDEPPLLIDIDVTCGSQASTVIIILDSDDEDTPETTMDSNDEDTPETDDDEDTPDITKDSVGVARQKLTGLLEGLLEELQKKPRANASKRSFAQFHHDSADKMLNKVEKTYKKMRNYRRMALGFK
ncbi:hypothetical protein ACEPPN_000374 [Leptodophora sp. 'Broadleaf-Isolate-01']